MEDSKINKPNNMYMRVGNIINFLRRYFLHFSTSWYIYMLLPLSSLKHSLYNVPFLHHHHTYYYTYTCTYSIDLLDSLLCVYRSACLSSYRSSIVFLTIYSNLTLFLCPVHRCFCKYMCICVPRARVYKKKSFPPPTFRCYCLNFIPFQ